MAQFPHLDLEESVQVNDKTRLDASKCFVSKGADALTAVEITPGANGTPVDVFVSGQPTEWYLDWEFSAWEFDIDSTNNKIDFEEATVLVATLTTGTYTLATLLTEIATQLNAAGSFTYTVTSDPDNKITISADGNFALLTKTGQNRNNQILKHIGFKKDTNKSLEQVGLPVEYGLRKITLTTDDDTTTQTETYYIKLFSEQSDHLFSSDKDLQVQESDILKWVKPGRNTYLDFHRRVQTLMFDWLAAEGYVDVNEEQFTKFDVIETKDLKEWSTNWALQLIFQDISNQPDDVFEKKSKAYEVKANTAKRRYLRIDIDKDGILDLDENLRIRTGNVFVR